MTHAASTPRRQPTVRPISQVVVELLKDGDTPVFEQTRRTILEWISRRSGASLPGDAWDGRSFTLEEIGAQRAEAVAIEKPRYWGARHDDADKNVAQRVWTTAIGIAEDEGVVLFGVRLQCVTHGEDVPFFPSVPTFVRDVLMDQDSRLDGRMVSMDPWLVDSAQSVKELCALLVNPRRRSDVIVFSLPEDSIDPKETAASAVDVARLLAGIAHVAIITGPSSYLLSDLFGREFSVFRRAVRTFRPGLNPDTDNPYNHPLTLPGRIETWPGDGPAAYHRFIVSQTLKRSVSGSDISQRLPSFAEVRRVASELHRNAERDAGSTFREQLAGAEKEIGKIEEDRQRDRDEFDTLIEIADREMEEAIQESQQLKAANSHLRDRVDALMIRLQGTGRSSKPEIPDSLDGLESWARANLSGAVELHNRAYRDAKKSVYNNSSLVYEALLLLRDYYVPMKIEGGIGLKEAFDDACGKLSVEEAPCFSGTRWGAEGDTYFVNYAGMKERLDRHLKKGNTRDKRNCFRLYFFWDSENQQVVVGSLPSHLETSIS